MQFLANQIALGCQSQEIMLLNKNACQIPTYSKKKTIKYRMRWNALFLVNCKTHITEPKFQYDQSKILKITSFS